MKKIVKVLFALLLVMSLCACNNNSASNDPVSDDSEAEKVFHVGVVQIEKHGALDAATQGFVDKLKEEFGDAIDIEVIIGGNPDGCNTAVNGFIAEDVDLIMANATPALQVAYALTGDIPILGTSVTEYGVALGIDNFNGLVGENVSGTSDLAPLDEQAKMVVDLVPSAKTVGIISCSSEANSKYQVEKISEFLNELGLDVYAKTFESTNELQQIAIDVCENCDVLFIPTDNTCAEEWEHIDSAASDKSIPIICGEENTCKYCGVATLTINYYDLGVTTGEMAVKILKGESKIEEMPIEYFLNPVKKYNKEIAERLGIEIPDDYVAID